MVGCAGTRTFAVKAIELDDDDTCDQEDGAVITIAHSSETSAVVIKTSELINRLMEENKHRNDRSNTGMHGNGTTTKAGLQLIPFHASPKQIRIILVSFQQQPVAGPMPSVFPVQKPRLRNQPRVINQICTRLTRIHVDGVGEEVGTATNAG